MDALTSGYVRGVLARAGNLSTKGRLDDAERALALVRPLLLSEPEPDTPYAGTWSRARLLEARLLIRRGGAANLAHARAVIAELERRIPLEDDPGGAAPLLTGNRRLVLYSGLGVTISRLGNHLHAAGIAERIAERSTRNPSRRHLNLYDAAVRYDAEAFSLLCRDARSLARARQDSALRLIDATLEAGGVHLPEGPQREASLQTRRSMRMRIVLGRLELDRRVASDAGDAEGLARVRQDLQALREDVHELLDRSFANVTATPAELANRHGRLGDVTLALARAAGDTAERERLAQAARVWSLPRWELNSRTADTTAALRLDYAECCALSGATLDARDILQRAVVELTERCGADYAPAVLAGRRLEALSV